jgi:hypothetical protein
MDNDKAMYLLLSGWCHYDVFSEGALRWVPPDRQASFKYLTQAYSVQKEWIENGGSSRSPAAIY